MASDPCQQRMGRSGAGGLVCCRGLPVLHAGTRGAARYCGRHRVAPVRRNAAFALGRAVPVILGVAAVGWLENLSMLQRYQRAFEMASAATLVLAGLYMLNAYFFVIPQLAI
jgi:hypothetical protein